MMTRHQAGRFDDWRARMAVRGGPLTHAVARAGWAALAVVGVVVMTVVAMVWAINPSEEATDNGPAANFMGAFILGVPFGAVVFGLIGVAVQYAARSWLRTPTAAERDAARAAQRPASPYTDDGLLAGGRWAQSYERCAASLRSFHTVVTTLPDGPGRNWLTDVGSTLDDELREALRLAKLGDGLAPDGHAIAGTPRRIADLLTSAERSFAQTADRAAAIALDLRKDTGFEAVRAQLDTLAAQTPHLRASGL